MRKIASFTAKERDTCVKCRNPIEPGQEIGWLRDANRKGYFHEQCSSLPTVEGLALVRVDDPSTREGFRYTRVQDLGGVQALLPEHPVAARLAVPMLMPMMHSSGADAPLPGPWKVKEANADGIIVNRETLAQLIAEAVAKLPRITVNVIVSPEQDPEAALEMLSKELFNRTGVNPI